MADTELGKPDGCLLGVVGAEEGRGSIALHLAEGRPLNGRRKKHGVERDDRVAPGREQNGKTDAGGIQNDREASHIDAAVGIEKIDHHRAEGEDQGGENAKADGEEVVAHQVSGQCHEISGHGVCKDLLVEDDRKQSRKSTIAGHRPVE